MPRRPSEPGQSFLFGDSPQDDPLGIGVRPAPAAPATSALAARLPPNIRLGTSSWTFPGWQGIVYDRPHPTSKLAAPLGLTAYAAHPLLRTVGLDRAFYALIPEAEFLELRHSVPSGFRFLVKANQLCTRPLADDRGQTFGNTGLATQPNALFLDPTFAIERIIAPALAGLGPACGPIVFQFPPLDLTPRGPFGGSTGAVNTLLTRLETFLTQLPRLAPPACYAVEVRNRSLLTPRFAQILRNHHVSHGYAHHPTLPTLSEQAERMSEAAPPSSPLVLRWLLRHDQSYQAARARYEPFDKIIDPDEPALFASANLAAIAAKQARDVYVIVNNKAEGSAPRSVERLAHAIADRL